MPDEPLAFTLRALVPADRDWVRAWMVEHWGSERMAVHGQLFCMDEFPGLAAELDGQVVGLATYRLLGDACELMSLDSRIERRGIGGALVAAVRALAVQAGCRRLRLTTTNDNLNALRFYQKRGFRLIGLHPGAVNAARRTLKPEIPLLGENGISIRDEIELEEAF
ncbi:GNAT family N-acetyltransferase [Longilinea arvoryzae]|nr:GNAT family N-acetyltransferase [Longilinea arvoryzae]